MINYGVCCVPLAPMRASPSHRSEMVSQLLFGEQCRITEKAPDNWIRIMSDYDNYEGWCQNYQVHTIAAPLSPSPGLTDSWHTIISFNGADMHLPFGSSIPGLHNGVADWSGCTIHYEGQLTVPSGHNITEASIRTLAFRYLNTAYLWGGRSVFGVDCSGFCQMVYRFLNIQLQRDAYQQATQGEVVGFLQEAKCGDLAFFDNDEGRITHVGILLNESEIIHSSVKVRVDKIDNMGIINRDTKQRTHKLRIIKRMIV